MFFTVYDALRLLEDKLDQDIREELIKGIMELLTVHSKNAIWEFQLAWQPDDSDYKEYLQEEALLIRNCVEAEMSKFGDNVRLQAQLDLLRPLTPVQRFMS